MSHLTDEVDLREAMRMLDVPEEMLGKISEERKLKSRRAADGTIYFVREQIEKLIDLQIEEARSVRSDEFACDDSGETECNA